MGLGAVHTVINLTEARAKAKECRQLLLEGKDPLDARRSIKQAEALERAKAMTFDQCATAYTSAQSTSMPASGLYRPSASRWARNIACRCRPPL